MITLPCNECQANQSRGRLKHSWLENQLLNKNPEEVVFLWQNTGWTALDKEFSVRIKEAVDLADNLENGFSPKELVEQLAPLSHIDEETKGLIKKAVHTAYLKSSNITDLKLPLRDNAMALGGALDELRAVWILPVDVNNEQILKHVWVKVSVNAKALHSILAKLPKGMVLP